MSLAETERIVQGRAASPGVAVGPLALHFPRRHDSEDKGDPESEGRRLAAAVEQAGRRLEALMAESEDLGADILAFQVALLEDPELTAPAEASIAAGTGAATAWRAALDAQIDDFRQAEDAAFAARAVDLEDLRDRVLALLAGEDPDGQETAVKGAIYLAQTLTPSRFLATDWTRYQGAALLGGSAAGHVAILARARGVPLIVGLEAPSGSFAEGQPAVLDGEAGRLIVDPTAETSQAYRLRCAQAAAEAEAEASYLGNPARTAAGEPVTVLINLDDLSLLQTVDPATCDGIGLVRTEMFMGDPNKVTDEDAQLRDYQRILDWAQGKPVTIRTLDVGGDKPIAGLTPEDESNSFLGLRGLRLSLARPEIFRVQLRALARAAVRGHLKVMLPMVTTTEELSQARVLFEEVVAELSDAGIEGALPPLGMMVEVPAAALSIADFGADFLSIGSNDLIQYTTAASRDNEAVANLYDPANPAVLALIRRVVDHGRSAGLEVSLCGDMASDPASLGVLLDLGLRTISVAPAALGRVKRAIAGHGSSEAP
jgi:phosphotransferase system enzyme I (PtsI)